MLQRRADIQQASGMAEIGLEKRSQVRGHCLKHRNTETLKTDKNLKESLEKMTHPSQEGYLCSRFSYILFLTF